MLAVSTLSLALFQEPVNPTGGDIHLIVIELGVIALFFLLIMIGTIVGGIMAMKMVKKVEAKVDSLEKRGEALIAEGRAKGEELLADAKTRFTPFVDKAQEIMEDLQPKIKSVSSDVEAISKTVRAKVEEVGETVSKINTTVVDVNGKTRNQVQRVDGIVTGALNTTHDMSQKIQNGIKYPINHFAGWIAGIKTGLETLAAKSPLFNKGKAKQTPGSYAKAQPSSYEKPEPNPYDL